MATKRRSFLGVYLRSLIFGQKELISAMEEEQVQSPFRTTMRNFLGRRLTQMGIVVVIALFLICFILPIFMPLDLSFLDTNMVHRPPGRIMMRYDRTLRGGNLDQIAVGSGFAVGLNRNGDVSVWGHTEQFGIDLVPTRAEMGPITQISAGQDHVVALNAFGWVFTWGNSNFNLPNIPPTIQGNVVWVEAGVNYSVALTNDGRMHVWGSRQATDTNIMLGQLGSGDVVTQFVTNPTAPVVLLENGYVRSLTRPGQHVFGNVPDEIQGRVVQIALTNRIGAAILDDGSVATWGSALEYAYHVPHELIGNNAAQIVAGIQHFVVLLNDGTVVGWGEDFYGQSTPPNLSNIVSIYSGFHHNYAVDASGNIHTWGLRGFLFGTDNLGRDVFTRTVAGGRLTMTVGALSVVIMAIIGVILGGFAGYFGGKVDMVIMRFSEIWAAIPFLPIAIILIHILGSGVSELMRVIIVMAVLGILGWTPLMRIVRGQILQTKEAEYVLAARALGVSEGRIIFKHIFPNIMSVITVWFTLSFAGSMLTESTLSFIGFGITEPTPTWGNIINAALDSTVVRNFWWRWIYSAIAITLAAVSINMIGDGLRDAIDPKAQER